MSRAVCHAAAKFQNIKLRARTGNRDFQQAPKELHPSSEHAVFCLFLEYFIQDGIDLDVGIPFFTDGPVGKSRPDICRLDELGIANTINDYQAIFTGGQPLHQ